MLLIRITVLFLLVVSSRAIPIARRYVDRDEQQFIDHLLLHSPGSSAPVAHIDDESDELAKEQLFLLNREESKADPLKNSEQSRLIKTAAMAVITRLSMPAPPKTQTLIDRAVQFVLKRSMPNEYAKIRSGIKEQVDKLIFKAGKSSEFSKRKKPVLRTEKVLTALEDIISELATQLKLTTLQINSIVNKSVDVLAKHFGLEPWQNHDVHERVSSHVRAKLNYQDLDDKGAGLRKLEESIEVDVQHLKLNAEETKRLEALMVEVEALREGLSKEERLRMLKRVIADIKEEFKREKKQEQKKLPRVNMKVMKQVIREKAAEMQLRKDELEVLRLAIHIAFDELSMHATATTKTQESQPLKATSATHKTSTETATVSPTSTTTTKQTETKRSTEKHSKPTTNPVTKEELEEEMLEGTHHPHPTSLATTQVYRTTPRPQQTSTNKLDHQITTAIKTQEATRPTSDQEDNLDAQLAADEAELEGRVTKEASDSNAEIERKAEELEFELERTELIGKERLKTAKPTARDTIVTTPVMTAEPELSTIVTEQRPLTKAVTQSMPTVTSTPEEPNKSALEEDLLENRVSTTPTSSHSEQATQHKTKRADHVTIPTSHVGAEITQPKTEHVTQQVANPVSAMKIMAEKGVHSRRHRVKIIQDEAEMEDLKPDLDWKIKKENKRIQEDDDLDLMRESNQNADSLEDELNKVLAQKDDEKEKNTLEDELKDLTLDM